MTNKIAALLKLVRQVDRYEYSQMFLVARYPGGVEALQRDLECDLLSACRVALCCPPGGLQSPQDWALQVARFTRLPLDKLLKVAEVASLPRCARCGGQLMFTGKPGRAFCPACLAPSTLHEEKGERYES